MISSFQKLLDNTQQPIRSLVSFGLLIFSRASLTHTLSLPTIQLPIFNEMYVAERLLEAFELSARLGLCSQEDPSRVRAHLAAMGMPRTLADIPGDLPDADGLIRLMGQDKKVKDGKLVFILARGIGDAFVARDIETDIVASVLTDALNERD